MDFSTSIFGTQFLTEGRKEDAYEKYVRGGNRFVQDAYNQFVTHDPSGNHKYLDWMLKMFTTSNIGWMEIKNAVKKFHDNLDKISPDFGSKDINAYKTVVELQRVGDLAESKLSKREEKKLNRDVIYEDDKWFVVVPHTHKASCYYGAATKWCTTHKSDRYWKKETKRYMLIYVIDKTKKITDDMYKIAWQKSYGKPYDWSSMGLKLWNVIDTNIAGSTFADKYLDYIPEEVKNKIKEYFLSSEKTKNWKELSNPKIEAIKDYLGDDIEVDEADWDHYGMEVYSTEGGEFAVGDSGEAYSALVDYYYTYIDDIGWEEFTGYGYDVSNYINVSTDWISEFAAEEGRTYAEDFNDYEAIEFADLLEELEEFNHRINKLTVEYENWSDEDAYADMSKESIYDEIERLKNEVEELPERARQLIEDKHVEEWEDCLSYDVLDCFVEKGWFNTPEEVVTEMGFEVDIQSMAEDMGEEGDYERLSPYGDWHVYMDENNDEYVVIMVEY